MKLSRALRLMAACLVVAFSLCGKSAAVCSVPITVSPAGPFSIAAGGGSSSFIVNTGGDGGISCHWNLSSSTFISASPTSGGGGNGVFQFTVNFSVPANPNFSTRSGSITVTQTEDGTSKTLIVNQAASTGSFALGTAPASQTVTAGGSTTYNISISRTGFTGAVHLTASLAGTTISFSPNDTTGTTSVMTVITTSGTSTGSFPIVITGSNGSVSHTASVTLLVNPAPPPTPTPTPTPVPSQLTSFVLPDTSSHTVYRDANKHLIDLSLSASNIWQRQDITTGPGAVLSQPGGGIGNTTNIGGCPHVFYIDTNLHFGSVYRANITGGCSASWNYEDLSVDSGAPALAAPSSPIATIGPSFGALQSEFFMGSNSHIYRIYWPGSGVLSEDLMAAPGAVLARLGGLASVVNAGGCPHVFYTNTNQHFVSLYQTNTTGGCLTGWNYEDLTTISGASNLTAGFSPVSSIGPSADALLSQFYVGSDNHIYRMYWPGTGVINQDLTSAAGGPLAIPVMGLTSNVNAGNCPHVFYIDTNNHVSSFYQANITGGCSTSWSYEDLTSSSGAGNNAANGTPITTIGPNVDAIQSQFYVGSNNDVFRLFWPATGGVMNQDISLLAP